MVEAITDELRSAYDRGGLQLVWVPPGSAQRNPLQWKEHPPAQLDALEDLIFGEEGVGWAGVGLINDRQVDMGWPEEEAVPTWVDAHAREALAQRRGDEEPIPALVGRWTPKQEKMILATLDPVGMLARYDGAVFQRLRDQLEGVSPALEAILDDTAAMAGLFDHFETASPAGLAEQLGPESEQDSWPVISVKVPHHSYVLWQELRGVFEKDHQAMMAALNLAAEKHLADA